MCHSFLKTIVIYGISSIFSQNRELRVWWFYLWWSWVDWWWLVVCQRWRCLKLCISISHKLWKKENSLVIHFFMILADLFLINFLILLWFFFKRQGLWIQTVAYLLPATSKSTRRTRKRRCSKVTNKFNQVSIILNEIAAKCNSYYLNS